MIAVKATTTPFMRLDEGPAELAVQQYVLIAFAGGAFAGFGFDRLAG